jgi:hypothetical protein
MKLMPVSKTVSAEPVEPKATEGESRPKTLRYPLGRPSTGSGLTVFFGPLGIT